MKRTLEEALVECMSFSPTGGRPRDELAKFSTTQWERCLTWMDDSGLALYFLRSVESHIDCIPPFVLERLQTKHRANLERTAYMKRQFGVINRAFGTAGIRYAAVKGLTLVPEFCPEASLRHQSDFDYLVDSRSLPSARRALEDIGYVLHDEKHHELILVLPCHGKPGRGDEQYESTSPHSVELHLTIMPEFRHLVWEEPHFLDDAIVREFEGSLFFGLNDDNTFVLQSIHAFQHILSGWIKLSWLYEIGFFIEKRGTDSNLWQGISERLASEPLLRESVTVVVGLASQFFGAHIPFAMNKWVGEVRPPVRTWIQNYARPWAFGHNLLDDYACFPTSKLILFLHQQYVADRRNWRRILSGRLLALGGIDRVRSRVARHSSTTRRLRTLVNARDIRRIGYHLGANLRYLWELPRWRRLTRGCDMAGGNSIPPSCSTLTQRT